MPKNTVHIQLSTKNDTNGNPRRLSLLVNCNHVTDMRDHGYAGHPREWGAPALMVTVSPKEYRKFRTMKPAPMVNILEITPIHNKPVKG